MSRRARIRGTLIALMLSALLALGGFHLTRDTASSRSGREHPADAGTSSDEFQTGKPEGAGRDDSDRRPRASGPNVVTHVDGIPVWALPEETIDSHLAALRALVDAGWSQAFVRLAPVAARCLTMPTQTDQQVQDLYHPDYGSIYRSDIYAEETERDRRIMRDQRLAFLDQRLDEVRRRRQRCRDALGDDPDPDRYMDWLELALEQQPAGFFRLMLDEQLVIPPDFGWLIRNAERLAQFNSGFLNALRARFLAGDPEVLGRAWKAFATHRFVPGPDPVQAWAYGLVARRLPPPLSDKAPTDDDVQKLVQAGLNPAAREHARETADALWRQCCAGGKFH